MSEKIHVSNTGTMPMYVAGMMILPGETRHFDADQVPPHLRPAQLVPEVDAPIDPMIELIGHSVKDIVALLPSLSEEQLDRLGGLEQAKGEDARKTLLSAIAEELLKRADANVSAVSENAGSVE